METVADGGTASSAPMAPARLGCHGAGRRPPREIHRLAT
jgi:hypothetical protein